MKANWLFGIVLIAFGFIFWMYATSDNYPCGKWFNILRYWIMSGSILSGLIQLTL